MQMIQTAFAAVDKATGFKRWGPDANPVIRHVKFQDQRTRISLRRAIWAGFLLGMAGLVWSTWDVLTLRGLNDVGTGIALINVLAWIMLLASPIAAATGAARHTSRSLRGERFDLVYITPLDNLALVRALVFDAFYQSRRWFAIMMALLPFMTVYVFYYFLEVDYAVYNYYYYNTDTPGYWDIVGPTLWVLAIMLGLWGFTLLGVVFGVRMGIFRANAFNSVLVALVGMTLTLLSPCVCFYAIIWTIDDMLMAEWLGDVLVYVVPVVFMITPWVLAWQVIRHTAWIWRRE